MDTEREELLGIAMAGIESVFSDTDRPVEFTLDILEEIADEVQSRIEALRDQQAEEAE